MGGIELIVYAVRSKDGKWFRAKGMYSSKASWVDDIVDARIYQKIGPARATVTFWANSYPEFGVPDIVIFACNVVQILNETERVKQSTEKKKKARAARELANREWELRKAEKSYEAAQRELDRLKIKDI